MCQRLIPTGEQFGLLTRIATMESGSLHPQVVVNLLPELAIGMDLVRDGNLLGERFKCGAEPFPQRAWRNRRRAFVP